MLHSFLGRVSDFASARVLAQEGPRLCLVMCSPWPADWYAALLLSSTDKIKQHARRTEANQTYNCAPALPLSQQLVVKREKVEVDILEDIVD